MSTTKLAIITFLEKRDGGDRPDNTLPGQPGVPTHPIHIPSGPDVIWPPVNPPGPDNTLPEPPPGFPVHLPVFPPVGPDNSLPGSQPKPDQGLPGSQPKPDQGLPKPPGRPDNTLPTVDRDNLFELKWTPVYGWVLVPVNYLDNSLPSSGAQPKKR